MLALLNGGEASPVTVLQKQYLGNIDWVAYYTNYSYQINSQCGTGGGRITFGAPVCNPQMQWAVPNSTLNGVRADRAVFLQMGKST